MSHGCYLCRFSYPGKFYQIDGKKYICERCAAIIIKGQKTNIELAIEESERLKNGKFANRE